MKEYRGNKTGFLLTAGFHLLLGVVLLVAGLRYTPPEKDNQLSIEIELEEERPPEPLRIIAEQGSQPRSPEPVPEEEPELVQQAIVPEEIDGEQRTQESTVGETGDVEIQDPDPPVINERALYRSRDIDTLAGEQTGMRTDSERQAGHSAGNTQTGNPAGQPTAQLAGRTVIGKLPLPEYAENLSGKVVVKIRVDTYGKVTSAIPGIEGTTVQNKILWEAARKAAMEARFNVSGTAPAIQEGKITYIFTLK